MASFNKVMIMGNLTRDPELRTTPTGSSICKFGIATTRTYTAQDGSQREEATFVDVDAFGKLGEIISKYFAKGRPIFIEGRLHLNQWETQTGEKRSKLSIILETFQFIGSKPNGSDNESLPQGTTNHQYEAVTPPVRSKSAVTAQDIDEDVPF